MTRRKAIARFKQFVNPQFYHPNFEHLREVCERGFSLFSTEDFALVRETVPMPAVLAFAGYPVAHNQYCFGHKGKTGTALSIFTHQDGFWYFYCRNPDCGVQGDVTSLWYSIVRHSGLAPIRWTKPNAAQDLLDRVRDGEIDASVNELASSSHPGDPLRPRVDDTHYKRLRRLIDRQQRKPRLKGGSISLPCSPCRESVGHVICGLFPSDGLLMITPKIDWHDIHRREYWLANYYTTKPPVAKRSFISASYLTRDDVNCSYAAFEGGKRRWLVLESDTLRLERQLWIHRELQRGGANLVCVCWSGGRSLHGWYFVEDWSAERCFELYAQAIRLGVSDCNTWRICQPVRLPNGWNHKTGMKQDIYFLDL